MHSKVKKNPSSKYFIALEYQFRVDIGYEMAVQGLTARNRCPWANHCNQTSHKIRL